MWILDRHQCPQMMQEWDQQQLVTITVNALQHTLHSIRLQSYCGLLDFSKTSSENWSFLTYITYTDLVESIFAFHVSPVVMACSNKITQSPLHYALETDSKNIQIFHWSPQSLYLNPIKHVQYLTKFLSVKFNR